MTDSINFSFSFQIDGPSGTADPVPAPSPEPPRRTYAYADCEQVILNDQTVVIVSLRGGGKMAVTRDVANALTYCLNFETLAAHAATLCDTIPMLRGQHADVLAILETARQAGILVGADDTAVRLMAAPAHANVAPTRVFIITCDRPAAIERLLESLLSAGDLARHDRLILIDDSRRDDNIQRNRELVGAFNVRSVKPMQYFGAQAARELLSGLAQALPAEQASLRFLLDRQRWAGQPTYGLARNLALLLSVGCRALVLDDDILCQAVRAPAGQPGIGFRHEEAREAWFYPAVPALLQQTRACDFSPLSRHADAVGQPLAAVLSAPTGNPLDLEHCSGNMLSVLDGSSPVLITQCGSAGDPGTVGSKWVTRLRGDSLQRLLAQLTDAQAMPQCRPCWLGYTQTTVSLRGVMSQMTGLDNSQLLPPYLPILRGEDALFASMATYLHPHSAVLNFDWAVFHLPLEDRSALDYDEPFTVQIHLGALANYLCGKIDTRGCGSPNSRLSALAADIRGLGECPAETLLSQARLELTRSCAASVTALERLLADAQNRRHPAWQAFIEQYAAQAQQALLATDATDGEPPSWVAPVQRAAVEFAEALEAWPRIREQSALATERMLDSGALLP